MRIILNSLGYFLLLGSLLACNNSEIKINSGHLSIQVNEQMLTKLVVEYSNSTPISEEFISSEYIVTNNFTASNFELKSYTKTDINDSIGEGIQHQLKGKFKQDDAELEKIILATTYEKYPDIIVFNVQYVNTGSHDLLIKKWVNNKYRILEHNQDTLADFWSFQGSSSAARADWILPVNQGFYQKNFMGMNDSDYGGGIPVVDLWRKDIGVAIGHLEMVPKELSLPVNYEKSKNYATVHIENDYADMLSLATNDTLKTAQTFVMSHEGDYFNTLSKFSKIMQDKGLKFVEPEPAAFEPIWCGWGYERSFTKKEILATLPKVKELGIKWAVIDDGYQIAEGDWRVDEKRFPGGSNDMKEMVEAIHSHGLKAKLWWAPLAADPGSKILKDDPLTKLINKEGAPQYITWWDSYYLSPAYQGTIDYTLENVRVFMDEWGFDGLKMDGQHMNAVPGDYNWERPLEYPEKSIEMLPQLFKKIYNTAHEINNNAVIENCPCGTCMSFYNMPYTNQFVSSDPSSSKQIRIKGKAYKAIAPKAAYFGDHVEYSDNGNDFASSFGVGAVLGTKFTWPKNNPNVKDDFLLTPEKELLWKKWFELYNELMLAKGEYLGELYDIGYDIPETHVILKNNKLYFAFYAANWEGEIGFNGLDVQTNYVVKDYFNDVSYGELSGENPYMKIQFSDYLLLELTPKK